MNTNTNRTHGYYWIFLWDEWQVAKWAGKGGNIDETSQPGKRSDMWFLCGIGFLKKNFYQEIKEIDENKIVRSGPSAQKPIRG